MVKKQIQMKNRLPLKTTRVSSNRGIQKKRKAQPAQIQSAPGMVINIPVETQKYGNSLCSPDKYIGAGIPAWPSLPTLKSNARIRGILSVGNAGIGFVYCAPEQLGVNDNAALLYTTGPAFLGSTFSLAAGVSTAQSNAQFASTAMGTTNGLARWRIVSACLRVRYISKEIDRGGSIIAFAHPEHISLTGMGTTNLLAFNTAKKVPVNREWTTVLYCPVNVWWQTAAQAEGQPDLGDRFMGIMVESSDPGLQFEFEFFGNYEYEGPNIRGKTQCYNDSTGLTTLQAAMQSGAPVHTGNNDASFRQSMWDKFKEYALKTVTWVGKELREVVTKAVPIVAEASIAALAAI